MERDQHISYHQLQYFSFTQALEELQHQVIELNSALCRMRKQFELKYEQQAESFHVKSVIHSTLTESFRQDLQAEREMRRILEEYLLSATKKQKLAERRLANLDRNYRKQLNRKIDKIVVETKCDVNENDTDACHGDGGGIGCDDTSDSATDTIVSASSSAKRPKIVMHQPTYCRTNHNHF